MLEDASEDEALRQVLPQAEPWLIWREVKRLALEVYAGLCGTNVGAFICVLFGEDMLDSVSVHNQRKFVSLLKSDKCYHPELKTLTLFNFYSLDQVRGHWKDRHLRQRMVPAGDGW